MKVNIQKLAKRFVPFALVFGVFLHTCIFSASASTYAERWTNVLEYSTVNNNGSNTLAVKSGQLFTLQLPGNTIIQDIDILFRLGTTPTSVKVVRDDGTEFSLVVKSLGSGLFRAYGNCQGYGFNVLGFKIAFNSTGTSYGQLLQCHISPQPVDFYNVGASISKNNIDGPSTHSPGSDTTVFNANNNEDFEIVFTISDWQKYDFIDFAFNLNGVSINSISAYIGDRSIPVIVESFDGDPLYNNSKMLTGYLDIYGVDHGGANVLNIQITGTHYSDSVGSIWLSWLNGFVKIDSPSIFALIWQSIKSGFASVGEWLTNGFNAVVSKLDEFVNGSDEMNENVDNAIDDMQSVGNDLENVGGALNSVDKPEAGNIQTGIDSFLPETSFLAYTAPIRRLWENDTLVSMFMIVLTLVLVSWVFFGKKG